MLQTVSWENERKVGEPDLGHRRKKVTSKRMKISPSKLDANYQ